MALVPFIATIQAVAFTFPPQGWAQCNGQLISIAQNTALFSLLGTNYGGNGQTTFGLPDLRRKNAIDSGQGPGLSFYSLGQFGGVENTSVTIPTMPSHNHNVTVGVNTALGEESNPTNSIIASKENAFSTTVNNSLGGVIEVPVGQGLPFAIRNPYLALNFCIALQGVYPSRN